MIKRRFYKQGGDSSDSSSSSSDSDSDSIPNAEEEEEEEELQEDDEREKKEDDDDEDDDNDEDEDDEVAAERAKLEKKKKKDRNKRNRRSPSPGSGYESEDSSVNDIKVDSSGLLTSEEENIGRDGQKVDAQLVKKANARETGEGAQKAENRTLNLNDSIQADFVDCVLKCKSVFKCRLCPRIVCLSEETIKVHLNSKRHARSKKLLGEGRLKLMLNSDGEIEEDLETHAERHIRTIALAQEPVAEAKKDKGRQRQSRRRKKKLLRNRSNKGKSEELTNNTKKKKRRKNEV